MRSVGDQRLDQSALYDNAMFEILNGLLQCERFVRHRFKDPRETVPAVPFFIRRLLQSGASAQAARIQLLFGVRTPESRRLMSNMHPILENGLVPHRGISAHSHRIYRDPIVINNPHESLISMDDLTYSVEAEIRDTRVQRPHVVILGAGASLAALPNGDRHGRQLPLMNNLVQVVGLQDQFRDAGLDPSENFETLYSQLHASGKHLDLLAKIDSKVFEYFSEFRLPGEATIYDALVLSLRPKDVIATFNWDPLLYQACARNHKAAKLPHVLYLHGNVAIGYCLEHRKKGFIGGACSVCRKTYTPSRILFPIETKGYNEDPYIRVEWSNLQSRLRNALMLTVFGYGAPTSDVEAIDLMTTAWGEVETREFEQTELIDIKPADELLRSWSRFVHTHHYDIRRDFNGSWIAQHPRRTCEAAWQQFFEAKFISIHQVPTISNLSELQAWFAPLLQAETSEE